MVLFSFFFFCKEKSVITAYCMYSNTKHVYQGIKHKINSTLLVCIVCIYTSLVYVCAREFSRTMDVAMPFKIEVRFL